MRHTLFVRWPLSLAAAAALMATLPAQAQTIYTYTGDTTGGATWNRPFEDFSGLSPSGAGVRYTTFEFTVDTAGDYTFLLTAPSFDPFLLLYTPSFSAASPLSNGLNANDDLLGLTTSGFSETLSAGSTYVLVHTGFSGFDFGAFSLTIGGPGVVAVVPEPETWALMLGGLAAVGALARRRRS